jgi:perosamine synthetase
MNTIPSYKLLEEKYANFVGSDFAVSCNTGTSALHLALVALGIKEGDEVIVPDFTMSACGFAVSYTGAKVITVDCDETLNIDVSKIEEKITSKTKAIMPVHIYGRLCDMASIMKIAKKYNLYVIEDASEAHGAVFASQADITCYSFYKNKIIHAEEGGICTTDDKKLYDKMQYLKNMAFGEDHDYFHTSIGFNYRMPETMAKQALESLANYEVNNAKRRQVEQWFDKYSKFTSKGDRSAVWVYDVLGKKPDNDYTRHFFKPLSTMPMWKQETGENSLFYSNNGFYYLVYPEMTEEEVKAICG